jgi:hypothetical protein
VASIVSETGVAMTNEVIRVRIIVRVAVMTAIARVAEAVVAKIRIIALIHYLQSFLCSVFQYVS